MKLTYWYGAMFHWIFSWIRTFFVIDSYRCRIYVVIYTSRFSFQYLLLLLFFSSVHISKGLLVFTLETILIQFYEILLFLGFYPSCWRCEIRFLSISTSNSSQDTLLILTSLFFQKANYCAPCIGLSSVIPLGI